MDNASTSKSVNRDGGQLPSLMKFLLSLSLLLSCFAAAQTLPTPSQVPWPQTDDSFYRQCIFNADGSYANTYAWFPNWSHPHGTTSSSKMPSTYIRIAQIRGYGMSVSQDGTQLTIQYWDTSWTIRATNTTATGTVQLRFASWTPNMNLIGLQFSDVSMMPGGWGITSNAQYPLPAMSSATLQNGVFTMVPFSAVIHNTCELWNTGMFTDIAPNP